MIKNQKRIVAVMVILLVVFSAIAFVLPFKMNGMFWLSYLSGIFAIAVQIYILWVAFKGADSVKSKFYGFPIARIGIIYMVVQLVLSFIFMVLAEKAPVWAAAFIYILIFAIAAIGFIGADVAREEIERQDAKMERNTSVMSRLRSLVCSLAGKCAEGDAKTALAELADEFRYSDPVSSDALKPVEEKLETAVTKLQETVSAGEEEQIIRKCKAVSELLEDRNRLCKLNKKK